MTYLEQHCQDGRHVGCVRDAICGCACHKRGTREWHERCIQYAYRERAAATSAAIKKYWTKNIREHEKAIDDMLAVARRAVKGDDS